MRRLAAGRRATLRENKREDSMSQQLGQLNCLQLHKGCNHPEGTGALPCGMRGITESKAALSQGKLRQDDRRNSLAARSETAQLILPAQLPWEPEGTAVLKGLS